MIDVREIWAGSTVLAVPALRPHFVPAQLVDVIDERLRPQGYRLVGVFDDESESAAAVAGFRVTYALVRGLHLVVERDGDDPNLPRTRLRQRAGGLAEDRGCAAGLRRASPRLGGGS